MADPLIAIEHELIQVHGLMQGLNHLLNDGDDAMNAVYPLGDVIEERINQLYLDIAKARLDLLAISSKGA